MDWPPVKRNADWSAAIVSPQAWRETSLSHQLPPFPPQRPMAGTRGGAEPEPSSPRPGPASPRRWRCCLGPRFVLGEAAELWVPAASCEAWIRLDLSPPPWKSPVSHGDNEERVPLRRQCRLGQPLSSRVVLPYVNTMKTNKQKPTL